MYCAFSNIHRIGRLFCDRGNAEFSTGLPRNFHGVTPIFPRGNAELSTALPQTLQLPYPKLHSSKTCSESKLEFLNWDTMPYFCAIPNFFRCQRRNSEPIRGFESNYRANFVVPVCVSIVRTLARKLSVIAARMLNRAIQRSMRSVTENEHAENACSAGEQARWTV